MLGQENGGDGKVGAMGEMPCETKMNPDLRIKLGLQLSWEIMYSAAIDRKTKGSPTSTTSAPDM